MAIAVLAAVLAFAVNGVRSDGLSLIREKTVVAISAEQNLIPALSLDAFLELTTRPGAVIIDARPEELFHEAHIPGAGNLPSGSSEEQYALVLEGVGYDRDIVVYCSGPDCEAAEEVAASLRDRGYQSVQVFSGGWEEWTGRNLPGESDVK